MKLKCSNGYSGIVNLLIRLFCKQENHLQNFKLPEPILCIGGFLQIELLGRVQTQATDDLFYIWLVLYTHILQSMDS